MNYVISMNKSIVLLNSIKYFLISVGQLNSRVRPFKTVKTYFTVNQTDRYVKTTVQKSNYMAKISKKEIVKQIFKIKS